MTYINCIGLEKCEQFGRTLTRREHFAKLRAGYKTPVIANLGAGPRWVA
jgi:hypothetical protein